MGWPELLVLATAPAFGSFLGSAILRLPTGQPLVWARSSCQACGRALTLRDLVPLASWTVQAGRCRSCGVWIGWFYPAVELAAVAIAVWSVVAVGPVLVWPTAVLGWTLLAAIEMQRRYGRTPSITFIPAIVVGIGIHVWVTVAPVWALLAGAAVGYTLVDAMHLWSRPRRAVDRDIPTPGLGTTVGLWVTVTGIPMTVLLGGVILAVLWTYERTTERTAERPGRVWKAQSAVGGGAWLTWCLG